MHAGDQDDAAIDVDAADNKAPDNQDQDNQDNLGDNPANRVGMVLDDGADQPPGNEVDRAVFSEDVRRHYQQLIQNGTKILLELETKMSTLRGQAHKKERKEVQLEIKDVQADLQRWSLEVEKHQPPLRALEEPNHRGKPTTDVRTSSFPSSS